MKERHNCIKCGDPTRSTNEFLLCTKCFRCKKGIERYAKNNILKNSMKFTVSEKCLICSKKFDWNQVIIIKAPEGACFCMKCIETFEDTNEYKGNEAWITTEYRGKEVWIKDN